MKALPWLLLLVALYILYGIVVGVLNNIPTPSEFLSMYWVEYTSIVILLSTALVIEEIT